MVFKTGWETYSEYFSIRNRHKNFIDFCFDRTFYSRCNSFTIKYYNIDAAILFFDILILPHCLGQKVTFKKNFGPFLKN